MQLAKAFGAEVTGVCSTAKTELVRSVGADHVIDSTAAEFTDRAERYDAILDIAGNRALSQLRRVLATSGTLVIVGGEGGGRWLGGFDRQLRALMLSPLLRQRLGTLIAGVRQADLRLLRELIEAGQGDAGPGHSVPAERRASRDRHLRGGHAAGKVVITV